MYMVSSALVDRGLKLQIPDVSPASEAPSEVAASTVGSEVLEVPDKDCLKGSPVVPVWFNLDHYKR